MYAEPRALSQKKRKYDEAAETAAKGVKLTESVWAVELSPFCKLRATMRARDASNRRTSRRRRRSSALGAGGRGRHMAWMILHS